MGSLNPEHLPVTVPPAPRPPRIWKFWGTLLWGLFIFAAMFAGQIAVVLYFVLRREGPFGMAAGIHAVGPGGAISLSLILGLPAAAGPCWVSPRAPRPPVGQ